MTGASLASAGLAQFGVALILLVYLAGLGVVAANVILEERRAEGPAAALGIAVVCILWPVAVPAVALAAWICARRKDGMRA